MSKCFKCLKDIAEGELICNNKSCIHAWKEFNRADKENKRKLRNESNNG